MKNTENNREETKKMELGDINEYLDLDTRFNGWFLIELAAILSLDDSDAGELRMAEKAFNCQERDVCLMLVKGLGDKVSITPMGYYTTFNKAIEKIISVFVGNFTPDEDGKPSFFFSGTHGDLKILFKHNGTDCAFVLAPSHIDCPVATGGELGLNILVSPTSGVILGD